MYTNMELPCGIPEIRRRQWQPTPVLLSGKSHWRRSLVGCSPWGLEELDTTEWLHFHFSLSCIGEGNGNPLQCSCLENPRDGVAWWAAVYGVTQSRTWLKRFSSSSSSIPEINTLLSVNFTSINKTKSKIHTQSCICFKYVRMADCGRRRMKIGIKKKKNNREGPCPDQWWIILCTIWE